MRRTLLVVALGLSAWGSACQPLYGGKAEKLSAPKKRKPPPEVEAAAAEVKFVDACKVDFFGDPTRAKPMPSEARGLVATGNTALDGADNAPDPRAEAGLVLEAISKYKQALTRDPYSSEATYRLAAAYGRTLRKGCAVALLRRLNELSLHPKYEADAIRMMNAAQQDSAFALFRVDADAAMGR